MALFVMVQASGRRVDVATGVRLGGEVEGLSRRFGARCRTVQREVALRRLSRCR
jgi:hypothetical protein